MQPQDLQETNSLVSEYLKANEFSRTALSFQGQLLSKNSRFKSRQFKFQENPRILSLIKNFPNKSRKEVNLEKEVRDQHKKFQQILHSSKQVFSVAINLMQLVNSMRESARNQTLIEAMQNYKIQLSKFQKIIQNEGKPEGEPPTETVMLQHKQKLDKYYNEKNLEGMAQVFLSLRVNALQISPELRKNLVYQLIRNDVLKIEETDKLDFALSLIDITTPTIRLSFLPLLSIISSTLRGVQYLTRNGQNPQLIERVLKMCKEQSNGSVMQRFCIALLQKSSIKENLIPIYVEYDMINWTLNLLKKSLTATIHPFTLEFGSAILANIIHTNSTLEFLYKKPDLVLKLLESLLKLMRERINVSVLMHILICLSYLSKDPFRTQLETVRFVQQISEFVEEYSQINTSENQAAQIDKRTVLDLCAHMFHPKDATFENSETMQLNELKTEDRIRQYENEQGELIFQCFQDQI